MPGLDLSQPPLHFVAVFQPSRDDGSLQFMERGFHAVGKATSDRLLFLLAARRPAQNVRLLALRDSDLLHFHLGPHPGPVILEQLFFKPLHLAAGRTRQILAATLSYRRQILFAHNAAIEYPDPSRLAILALYHAQHCLHGRDVAAVAVECFVTEREALVVDDQRDHQLLAVGPMIPGVAAANHRILFRRALHIRARQIVKKHVELGTEQHTVALFQMPLQFRLVRQDAVQAAIQTRVVDLAVFDLQKIVQRGRRIPALLDGQLAARRAETVDCQ